jgi:adenosylhomocysteine nucleosidase
VIEDRIRIERLRQIGNLCIVAPLELEFKTAATLLTEKRFSTEDEISVCRGRLDKRQVTVLKSGMSAIGFAERLANHLLNNRYDALIVAGLAGGLTPDLKSGDAVVYDMCYKAGDRDRQGSDQGEGARVVSDDRLTLVLSETLRASGLNCVRGTGVTVRKIIPGSREKISLGIRYNADAVDMETYEVLVVCAQARLPATALRIVLDTAETDLPNFNRATGPDGHLSISQAASVMSRTPLLSLRFLFSVRPVVSALRENLQAVLNA